MYQNLGENQIKEIINAAKHSVFFIDEDQRVTWKDIGETQEIIKWAKQAGANVQQLELASQFRCNGSQGYLAWVDNSLDIKSTVNKTLKGTDYDFRVFDSPNELRDYIFKMNRTNNKARIVAGYCWDWVSTKEPDKNDIVFEEHNFSMKWNLKTDGSLWIMKPETVNEIGCIHTCQGLEVDYIGVIIGPDLLVRNGCVITDASKRSKNDSSVRGFKKLLKNDPDKALARADIIIKNTYRTLMTRGQKGCYVYSTDPETNAYFAEMINAVITEEKQETQPLATRELSERTPPELYPGLTLKLIDIDKVMPFKNSVPIYDLQMAAGQFSNEQLVDGFDWVELPDSFRPQKGHFVTRVTGESMNKRIPNGSWCLFKANPGGSRNNKVVIVQHRDIQDQDTGSAFTIKIYRSEKVSDGEEWQHSKIILSPDSNVDGYEDLVFDSESAGELIVVGEFVAVIA